MRMDGWVIWRPGRLSPKADTRPVRVHSPIRWKTISRTWSCPICRATAVKESEFTRGGATPLDRFELMISKSSKLLAWSLIPLALFTWSVHAAAQTAKGKKVFMITDMEGVDGI